MNKKILLATITLFASLTMFIGCSSTSTSLDDITDETVVSSDTNNADISDGYEYGYEYDEFMDMENIEMTEEELMALLGITEPQETFVDGELCADFGSADSDLFDVVFDAGDFTFAYNGSQWIESGFDVEGTVVVLVDTNPVDFESPANIYITPISELPSFYSINEYLQMIIDQSLSIVGVDILSTGVDFIDGFEVGMIETVEKYTDEIIDELIEIGFATEEDLEDIGGREFLLSLPDMHQVFMIARLGEDLYTFSGAYYSNDDKRDELIEAVDGYLSTLVPRTPAVDVSQDEDLDTDTEETEAEAEEEAETETEE